MLSFLKPKSEEDKLIESAWGNPFTLERRRNECQRILNKYPDRIAVIVVPDPKNPSLVTKYSNVSRKYLVPNCFVMGQFVEVVRKRIKLAPTEAIWFFINNKIVPNGSLLSVIYDKEKSADGFLYMVKAEENAFGK